MTNAPERSLRIIKKCSFRVDKKYWGTDKCPHCNCKNKICCICNEEKLEGRRCETKQAN